MLFNNASERQINIGLAVLRVVLGVVFIAHGGQKLFVYGFDGVATGFAQMGVPMAAIVGPFIGMVEFLGGFALIAGLLTRLAALGIGATMVGAIVLVHLKAGFFAPNGMEFPLSLLAAAFTLTLTGAGAYSIDALIGRRLGAVRAEQPLAVQAQRAA